jgi:hypothetical protein
MTPITRILFAGFVLATSGFVVQAQSLPTPQLVFKSRSPWDSGMAYVTIGVANWRAYDPAMFSPAPQLPQCAYINTVTSRTLVVVFDAATKKNFFSYCSVNAPSELETLYFTVRQFGKPPKSIYIFFQDRLTGQRVRSNVVTIP